MSQLNSIFKIEKQFFTPTYHFKKDSEYFGTLSAKKRTPKAQFIAKEGKYIFYREKNFEGNYYCKLNNRSVLKAYKPNGIGLRYTVEYDKYDLDVKPGSKFFDGLELNYDVFQNEALIGGIYQNPTKFLLKMEFQQPLEPIVQCFIFWLAFRAWTCERSWSMVDVFF